jgi:pimeloyl-ACP methyl ester carboxylesterase
VLSLVLSIGALYGIAYLIANRFVYQPVRYPNGWWDMQAELGARDVWLRASDGIKLHAWMIESPGNRPVTLYLHGNGDNLSLRPGHLREISAAGTSVLILDYRGFGRSEGRPTERGLYRDAEAAYDYLTGRYRPEQIVVHGESLGSAVAVHLAARRPCAAVVLECPITSVTEMAARTVPVLGPLFVRGFDARRKIAGVHVPMLIIHGDDDRRVPYAIGRSLYEAANEPKQFWTVEGARHQNIVEVAGPRFRARLQEFYDSLGLLSRV